MCACAREKKEVEYLEWRVFVKCGSVCEEDSILVLFSTENLIRLNVRVWESASENIIENKCGEKKEMRCVTSEGEETRSKNDIGNSSEK